jgi:aspartate carbamoyltransferase catalytic subunit
MPFSSLANLLSLFDVKINYVSPSLLRMPADQVKQLGQKGVKQREVEDVREVLDSPPFL